MLSGLAFWLMGRESAKSFLQTNYKKAMIKEKDDSMKKHLKIAVGILIATAVLCVVQYGIETYQKPVKTEVSYETTGCVIWDETYEIIPVEIKGTRYSYLWKNEDDYFLGTLIVGEMPNGKNDSIPWWL